MQTLQNRSLSPTSAGLSVQRIHFDPIHAVQED
jgi:hypothetical protein